MFTTLRSCLNHFHIALEVYGDKSGAEDQFLDFLMTIKNPKECSKKDSVASVVGAYEIRLDRAAIMLKMADVYTMAILKKKKQTRAMDNLFVKGVLAEFRKNDHKLRDEILHI